MESALRILATFALVFLLLTMAVNFLTNRYPRIPGDIYFQKPGLNFYLPFTSALGITIFLVTLFSYFFR
jgi:hypothetical protein